MHGTDHQTSQMFSHLSPEQMVPEDHPLRVIRPLANAALDRLLLAFSKLYLAIGRPSIPPEQLLRALLVQTAFVPRQSRSGGWHIKPASRSPPPNRRCLMPSAGPAVPKWSKGTSAQRSRGDLTGAAGRRSG